MSTQKALIVGAGVAGLTLARRLVAQDWQVTIVEHAPDLRTGGYMLGLSGPGYNTIRDMGLLPDLQAIAHVIGDKLFFDDKGREIYRIPFEQMMAQTDYLLLNRNDLVASLAAGLHDSVDFRFGTTIRHATIGETVSTVELSNGDVLEVDLLVGTDGIRSALRPLITGQDHQGLQPLGYRFGAYEVDNVLGLDGYAIFHTAPGHFAEYYPLPNKRLAALQVWPSAETGFVPMDQRWTVLRDVAKGAHADVHRVLDLAEAGPYPILDDLILTKPAAWSKGSGIMLGDAAHCLTFISGQGAGMAITSAGILADELAHRPVAEAIAETQRRVRPAIDRLQIYSSKRARGMIPSGPLAYRIRMVMMRLLNARLKRPLVNALEAERLAAASILPSRISSGAA